MSARRVAIATCAEVRDLDAEGQVLLDAFARCSGLTAEPAVWDDPGLDWDRYELILLRSTWDYPQAPERFASWCERIGERLVNPPAMVRWSSSKRYLGELAADGVAVIPTSFVFPGERPSFPAEGGFVVKPAVSAGSKDTARYDSKRHDQARRHIAALHASGREVVIQPYLESVDSVAETAVIVLGGEISHAMRKAPLLELDQAPEAGLFRPEEMSPRRPAADEISLARRALEATSRRFGVPIYARVDMLRGDDGSPLVLELELIEPSLFLDHDADAAARLVGLIGDHLDRSIRSLR